MVKRQKDSSFCLLLFKIAENDTIKTSLKKVRE